MFNLILNWTVKLFTNSKHINMIQYMHLSYSFASYMYIKTIFAAPTAHKHHYLLAIELLRLSIGDLEIFDSAEDERNNHW